MAHAGARILVAESDAILLMDLAASLREAGYNVFEAGNGLDALHLLDYPDEIDVVVTSLGTRGADGLEVARKARTHGEPVPVVFVSGRNDLPEAHAHPPARSHRLAKPFTVGALCNAIEDLLAHPRA